MTIFTAKRSRTRKVLIGTILFCLLFNLFAAAPLSAEMRFAQEYFRPVAVQFSKPPAFKDGYFSISEGEATMTVLRAEPIKPRQTRKKVYTEITANTVAVEVVSISPDHVAVEAAAPVAFKLDLARPVSEIGPDDKAISADDRAIGPDDKAIRPDDMAIGPDHVAADPAPQKISEPERIKTPPAQVVEYARQFWDETDRQINRHNISISGTKTFGMKKADVSGDIGHFSTENYDSMPGFHLDQSLHLEIDGNITENSTVHAVLDDKDDEDRRFTVNIDGPVWKFVMGDFPLAMEGTEFSLFRKEVRGIMAQGAFHERFKSIFLFSQSKGMARREQFRGAGQQQEFRLQGSPVVQNSERVSIDGRQLTRGSDYLVDYEDGLLKLLPHVLPVELTSWIIVEYEVSDKTMAFSRNLFGTRHVYTHAPNQELGVSWLREVDSSTPKAGDNASSTATPMQHDVVGVDLNWKLSPHIKVAGETAVSYFDPNKNAELTPEDKCLTGHASRLALSAAGQKYSSDLTFKKIGKNFKVVGREGGVTELGERGLVNDILTGRARLEYRFTERLKMYGDAEQSETNTSDDPTLQSIDYTNRNTGVIYQKGEATRFEVRGGRQHDREKGPMTRSDVVRDTATAVWDKKIGKLNTQAKIQQTAYNDALNLASDSAVFEASFLMGAEADKTFAWNLGASRIAVQDEISPDNLRSETRNYNVDLNYEPNRVFSARGVFQWRSEDDYYANSRLDTEIADSQLRYQPTRDLRTQLKYKVENTSKVLRDPTLDPEKYVLPPSLPNSEQRKEDILNTFENPVQKTSANFITDYRVNRYLQAYFDWRRRELIDQSTDNRVSLNDRKTYELRYTPLEKMLITTEYEEGVSKNINPKTELKDYIKMIQVRHEFYEGCFLDATYEERDEDDTYTDTYDQHVKSKILGFERKFNAWASLELGLQHNDIKAAEPSTEWEKRLAVVLSPFSRSQRYRFFINHKDITAKQSGTHYEGGLNFSQFIGTDTMIDGEFKKVHSTPGISGSGYDALVFNAKMIITF